MSRLKSLTGSLCTFAGFGCFIFLTYTQAQRKYQDDASSLAGTPPMTYVEAIIAVILCVLGGLQLCGELKPISVSLQKPTMDSLCYRPDFMQFRSRSSIAPVTLGPVK